MPLTKPHKFAHIVYRTRQFDRMIEWYGTVFGATTQHRDPVIAFLTYDDEHHRMAFLNLDVIDPEHKLPDGRGAVGVDHVAYTFGSLRDLLENHAELKALGITPYWALHHGLTVSLYYQDPDRNQMEFQIESCETNDEANAFLRSEYFATNPIGVEFDPDAWLIDLRAGTPASAYLKRSVHQPVSPVRGALFA